MAVERIFRLVEGQTFKLPSLKLRSPVIPHTEAEANSGGQERDEAHHMHAMDTQTHRAFWLSPFFLYLGALLICYISVVVIPYAYMDDYVALGSALHQNLTYDIQFRVAGGRPILAVLFGLTFSHVRGVSDLGMLRLGAIIALAVLAYLLYRALVRAGMESRRALPIPLIVCTLPSIQIYVAWAIASYAVLAMVLSGVSALLAEQAYDKLIGDRNWGRGALLGVGAVAVLLFALAIGQPPAMVYWIFAAISLLVAPRTLPQIVKRFAAFLGVAFTGIGLEYLVVKYFYSMIYGRPNDLSRTALLQPTDIPIKIRWFFSGAITDSLNFYNIGYTFAHLLTNTGFAMVAAAIILIGLPLYFSGSMRVRIAKTLVALCLVPLAYLPNLVVAENWSSFRTQAGLGGLISLYAVLAVCGIFDKLGFMAPRLAIPAVLTSVALLGLVAAARNVTVEIAVPSYIELHVAVAQLEHQKAALHRASKVYFVEDTWQDDVAPDQRYDEFGIPSGAVFWTPTSMTYLALQKVDPDKEDLPVVVLAPTATPPPGGVVINMRDVAAFGLQSLP